MSNMPLYDVYGVYSTAKFIGQYDAPSEEEAMEMAQEDADDSISLCFQCGEDLDESELQLDRLEAEEAAEENDDK